MSTADLTWRKSSFSGNGSDGDCVEIAFTSDFAALRDSKNPTGAVLVVRPGALVALVGTVKVG